MAITSPPYFDTEKYLGGEQSRETSSNYEQWCDMFYRVLIQKTFDALKAGGVFCLQVGSQRYPLLMDGTTIAKEIGFEVLEVRPTEMVNNQTKTDEEKGEVVIILKK
jgi:tRNA1(Val) A37 N6-methylase TrmN6